MSNHSVGHAMSDVVATVLGFYDEGKIEKAVVLAILDSCVNAACEWDGNRYEVFEGLEEEGRCGCCLRKGLEIHGVDWDKVEEDWELEKLCRKASVSRKFCTECAEKYGVPLED